jgi:integrase
MGRDGGGVRAASASSIEITFQYQGVRCRERVALKPTPANLKRAEQHKAAIEHSIAVGKFDYAATFPKSKRALSFKTSEDRQNLGVYLNEWIERKSTQLKSSTSHHYKDIIRGQLIPMFGNLSLNEITVKIVREKLSSYAVGNKTLNNVQSCLRSSLNDAVEDELLEINPLAGWKYRNREELKEEDDVDPFTVEEQAAILAATPKELRPQIQFSFWTGLRPSELVALEWGDIDWIGGEIRIVRAKTRAATEPESPKTISGRRSVKILSPAREALLQQKAATFLAGGRVFMNPNTRSPWEHSGEIRRVLWLTAMKKSGVRYRRPYQSRHTYASMMLSAGEHPMWVAKQLGHKDWTMIARVYGRWMPSADVGAGGRAEQLFAGNASIMTTSPLEAAIYKE